MPRTASVADLVRVLGLELWCWVVGVPNASVVNMAVARAARMVVVVRALVRAVAATEETRVAARAAARVAHLPLDESHARVARAVLGVVRHTVSDAGTG